VIIQVVDQLVHDVIKYSDRLCSLDWPTSLEMMIYPYYRPPGNENKTLILYSNSANFLVITVSVHLICIFRWHCVSNVHHTCIFMAETVYFSTYNFDKRPLLLWLRVLTFLLCFHPIYSCMYPASVLMVLCWMCFVPDFGSFYTDVCGLCDHALSWTSPADWLIGP